ncbi:Globin [Aphelenchoides bicaudatus]|nr:Globin [Aphelenchoides bicaudatus]
MAEFRQKLLDSLKTLNLDDAEHREQHGKDFYKYFFTNFPDLRKYFKGAEHYTAEDVQKSERFAKQGQRILLAVHHIVVAADRPDVIKAFAREQIVRHKMFKMQIDLWHAFWEVWTGFLASRGETAPDLKEAWKKVGYIFSDECVRFQQDIGGVSALNSLN